MQAWMIWMQFCSPFKTAPVLKIHLHVGIRQPDLSISEPADLLIKEVRENYWIERLERIQNVEYIMI